MPWGLSKSPSIKSKFSDLQDKYKNITILQGYQEDELRIFWRYLYAVSTQMPFILLAIVPKTIQNFPFHLRWLKRSTRKVTGNQVSMLNSCSVTKWPGSLPFVPGQLQEFNSKNQRNFCQLRKYILEKKLTALD